MEGPVHRVTAGEMQILISNRFGIATKWRPAMNEGALGHYMQRAFQIGNSSF
jgi:hypothetical protein